MKERERKREGEGEERERESDFSPPSVAFVMSRRPDLLAFCTHVPNPPGCSQWCYLSHAMNNAPSILVLVICLRVAEAVSLVKVALEYTLLLSSMRDVWTVL